MDDTQGSGILFYFIFNPAFLGQIDVLEFRGVSHLSVLSTLTLRYVSKRTTFRLESKRLPRVKLLVYQELIGNTTHALAVIRR